MLDKTQCPIYTINYSEHFDQFSESVTNQIEAYIQQKYTEGKTLEQAELDMVPHTQIRRYWISEAAADDCIAMMTQIKNANGYDFNIVKYNNPEFVA